MNGKKFPGALAQADGIIWPYIIVWVDDVMLDKSIPTGTVLIMPSCIKDQRSPITVLLAPENIC